MSRHNSNIKAEYPLQISNNPQSIDRRRQRSDLVEEFTSLRDKMESVERKNKQFMENIRMTQLSRSKQRNLSRSQSKIQPGVSSSGSNQPYINLEMEIERLNNKITQQRRSKELLLQQINLLQSRCQREKSRQQKMQQDYKNKMTNLGVSLTQQIMGFSDQVVKETFLKIQRRNDRNKQMLDELYIQLKKRNKKIKSKSKKKSIDQPFKKKQPDTHLKKISQKYEQLFTTKNQELENQHQLMKAKDKQIKQLKMAIDRQYLKEKEQASRSSTLISELQQKLKYKLWKDEIPLTKKESRQSRQSQNKSKQLSQNMQVVVGNLKSQLKEKATALLQSNSRVFTLEKLAMERANSIESLQKDLYSQKLSKSLLLGEYQSVIQRNKSQSKAKLSEVSTQIDELKSTISRKDVVLVQTKARQNNLLSKIAELETEIGELNQKLQLRQELYLRPIEPKEDLLIMPKNSSIIAPSFEQRQLQNLRKESRLLLLEKQQLSFQRIKVGEQKKRLQEERQSINSKFKQSEQSNRSLKSQIIELQKQLLMTTYQQKAITSTLTGRSIEELQGKIEFLQSNNRLLQKQNIQFNSQLIKVQHDLKLSVDLQAILESKQQALKEVVEQSEKRVLKRQEELTFLNKIVNLQKEQLNELKLEHEFKNQNYKEELWAKSLQIEKLNEKFLQLVVLQREANENNDQRIRLQLKIKSLEEDLSLAYKEAETQKRLLENEIERLKTSFEGLIIKNIENEETIKFQSAKINQIENKMFPEGSNTTQGKQIVLLATKIKNVQQSMLELEISKVNFQRQFQESQKLRQNLKDENIKMTQEIECMKTQFNKLLFKSDEKVEEQDKIIRALENSIKEKEKMGEASGIKRSEKSGISNSCISTGQIDLTTDDNFDLLEKLPYAFEKLHLKRKGHIRMMEKITQYIKNLKKKIEDQNKSIQLLNKRVEALRHGDFSTKFTEEDTQFDNDKDLRAFEVTSLKQVNVNRKHTRRIRALEDEKELILQQNIIFQKEVSALQDELLIADQEEKNYIRMKEIYKQEISRQRKAIEEKSQHIKKLTQQGNLTNLDNLKDAAKVFVKIMTIILSTQRASISKKDELEEYLRVISCLLQLDQTISKWIIQQIRR